VLHVGVKDPLRELARQGRIGRDKVAGRFVYFSADAAVRKAQWRARKVWEAHPRDRSFGAGLRVVPDELKAAIVLFFSLLDERQRTVARGRKQLHHQDVERERVRTKGGGRKPAEKKRQR
jgi:hypothetical protein